MVHTELFFEAVFSFLSWDGHHPGVVTEDIDAVVVLFDTSSEGLNRIKRCKVTLSNVQRGSGVGGTVLNFGSGLLSPVGTPTGHDHGRTVGGESIEGLSPQYAAPEQFDEGYGSTDDITDIYQLGAVFYELFTGQPPFEGKPAKAMHKVLHEQPPAPSEVVDVPDKLDDILLTTLAKEKSDRYDNIVYLRDALQDLYEEW